MQMAKSCEVRDQFKKYCDAAYEGEAVHVSRTGNRNVVIISENVYEEFMQLKQVAEIEAAVKRAEEDIKAGRIYHENEVCDEVRARLNGRVKLHKSGNK